MSWQTNTSQRLHLHRNDAECDRIESTYCTSPASALSMVAGGSICFLFTMPYFGGFFSPFVFEQEIGTTVHKLLLRMISKSDVNEVSDC